MKMQWWYFFSHLVYFKMFHWLSRSRHPQNPFAGGDKDAAELRNNPYVRSLLDALQRQRMEELIITFEQEIIPVAQECGILKREIKALEEQRDLLVKARAKSKATLNDFVTIYRPKLRPLERVKLWRFGRTIKMTVDEFLKLIGRSNEDSTRPKPPKEGVMSIITLIAVSGFVSFGFLHLFDIDFRQVIAKPSSSAIAGFCIAFFLGFGLSSGFKKAVVDGITARPNSRFNYVMMGAIVAFEILFVAQGMSGLLSYAQAQNPMWNVASAASGALGVMINMYLAWSTAQKILVWKAEWQAWKENEENSPERANEVADLRRQTEQYRQSSSQYEEANDTLKQLEQDLQETKAQLALRLQEQNDLLDTWLIAVRFALGNGSEASPPTIRDRIRSDRGVQEWEPFGYSGSPGDTFQGHNNGGSTQNGNSQPKDSSQGSSPPDEPPASAEEERGQA